MCLHIAWHLQHVLPEGCNRCLLLRSCYALAEHEYTEANLKFEHLKGKDRAMVQALSACRGFDVHLVLVTRTITEDVEDECYGKRYCRDPYAEVDSEDEGEEDEGEDDASGKDVRGLSIIG
jgi:hypothetical protein